MPLPSPLPPPLLSIGNIITVGLQLYRQHFKTYFRLALVGTSWLVLPLILLAGAVVLLINLENGGLLLAVVVPIALGVCLLWGFAHYQAYAAAIIRLAYGELSQTAETVDAARQYTTSRKWGFWLIGFLLLLLYIGMAIGVYILLAIVLFVVFLTLSGIELGSGSFSDLTPETAAVLLPAIGGAFLLIGIPAIFLFLWVTARLFIAEVPYAIEPDLQPGGSLSRGWRLTRQNSRRLILLFVNATTVLIPLQFFYQVISNSLQVAAAVIEPDQSTLVWVALIISYGLSLLLNVFVLPFWQAVKATTYYDLRSRREGLGVALHDAAIESSQVAVQQWFHRIRLQTPESVELEFTLAGIGNRAIAVLLDYTFLIVGWLLFWILWGTFSVQLITYLEPLGVDYSDAPLWLLAIGILATFLLTSGYFVGFEVLRQGQTPGKRYAHIRVIRDDGRPVGLAQALLRSLLQPIDYFCFLGAFLIIFGNREKRIGDWVAGTVVIQENRTPQQIRALSPEAKQLAVDLPQNADLTQLQPDQFAIISEYLQRRSLMEMKVRSELSLDLARQIRSLIQLDSIPQGLTSDQFLEAVYLAYQQQFPAY